MSVGGFDVLPKGPGICMLLCDATGRAFVSGSMNLKDVWWGYLSLLRNGDFPNPALQQDFQQLGAGQFHFEILEADLDPEIVKTRRAFWLNQVAGRRSVYNFCGPRRWGEHEDRRLRDWPALKAPDGEVVRGVRNLRRFCRVHDLDYRAMWRVCRGRQRTHRRGWRLADAPGSSGSQPSAA